MRKLPVVSLFAALVAMVSIGCNSPTSSGSDGVAPAPLVPSSPDTGSRQRPTPTPTPAPTATPIPTPTPTITPKPTPTPSATPTPTPTPTPTSTPTPTPTTAAYDALIFTGSGVNASNAQAVIQIVSAHGLTYETATSDQLNSMTLAQIASHRTLIWPGGNADDMNAGLTSATRLRVRQAVVQSGVGYTGFCAGAWFAVGPEPGSSAPYWGLALVISDYLKQYYPNGQDPPAAMVQANFADGTERSLVWWKGPILPSLSGGIVAKYPEGYAAITQSWAGKGYVTISGLHPEAPESWRTSGNLVDPDGLDTDIAWNLISSALRKQPQAVF